MSDPTPDLPPLLGQARVFVEALERVSLAAPLDRPVLVIGERGTGKELVAARLHYLSRRWDRPYLRLNCAALSPELLDSELFGHEAGAFTGAARRHLGRFERAEGGTLLLDEIANASPLVQEKLLRAVEYGEFERVGGSAVVRADVRVIGATNIDLPTAVAAGRFRADLLDRLAFDVITLPPLRARPEDIPLLAEHFAQAMSRALERRSVAGFTPAALDRLAGHDWPGNVRELRNVVERAVYRTPPGRPIDQIPLDPFDSPWRPAGAGPVTGGGAGVPATPSSGISPDPVPEPAGSAAFGLIARLDSHEARLLEEALAACRYNQRAAAARLGLSYDQLRGRMRRLGLKALSSRAEAPGNPDDAAER